MKLAFEPEIRQRKRNANKLVDRMSKECELLDINYIKIKIKLHTFLGANPQASQQDVWHYYIRLIKRIIKGRYERKKSKRA